MADYINGIVNELQLNHVYCSVACPTNLKADFINSNIGVVSLDDDAVTQLTGSQTGAGSLTLPQLANSLRAKSNVQNVIVLDSSGKTAVSGENSAEIQKIIGNPTSVNTLMSKSKELTTATTQTVSDADDLGQDPNFVPFFVLGCFAVMLIFGGLYVGFLWWKDKAKAKKIDPVPGKSVTSKNYLTSNHPEALKITSFHLPEIQKLIENIEKSKTNNADIQYQVEQIKENYIPNTLNKYYKIDEASRTKVLPGKTTTPVKMVSEQFGIIKDELTKINDAINNDYVDDLEVQSRFLKEKYKQGTNELTL